MQRQLALLDRAAQVGSKGELLAVGGLLLAGVQREDGVAPFGGVHRAVGALQQAVVVGRVRRGDGDAERHVQLEGHPRDHERTAQGLGDARRQLLRLGRLGAVSQHGELVAAQPSHERARLAREAAQAVSHLPQQLIARKVPEGVVDLLELVQVHEDQRERPVQPHDPVLRLLLEQQPVGERCQRIVPRQVLRIEPGALGGQARPCGQQLRLQDVREQLEDGERGRGGRGQCEQQAGDHGLQPGGPGQRRLRRDLQRRLVRQWRRRCGSLERADGDRVAAGMQLRPGDQAGRHRVSQQQLGAGRIVGAQAPGHLLDQRGAGRSRAIVAQRVAGHGGSGDQAADDREDYGTPNHDSQTYRRVPAVA